MSLWLLMGYLTQNILAWQKLKVKVRFVACSAFLAVETFQSELKLCFFIFGNGLFQPIIFSYGFLSFWNLFWLRDILVKSETNMNILYKQTHTVWIHYKSSTFTISQAGKPQNDFNTITYWESKAHPVTKIIITKIWYNVGARPSTLLIIRTPTVACSVEIYYPHISPHTLCRFLSIMYAVCAPCFYVSSSGKPHHISIAAGESFSFLRFNNLLGIYSSTQ